MRPYATVVPTFWASFRSRVIKECGADAQAVLLLALYGITSPGSNMLGLYYLPLPIIAHETGLTLHQVTTGLEHLKRLEFCEYDTERELIWVRKMAKFQIGEALSAGDKRCAMVRKEIARLGENELTQQFIGTYSHNYHLSNAPSMPLKSPIAKTTNAPSKGLPRTTEGATNPVIQEQEQEEEQEEEQEQEESTRGGAFAPGGASATGVAPSLQGCDDEARRAAYEAAYQPGDENVPW